jgi:hypothetical protein
MSAGGVDVRDIGVGDLVVAGRLPTYGTVARTGTGILQSSAPENICGVRTGAAYLSSVAKRAWRITVAFDCRTLTDSQTGVSPHR